MSTVRLKNPVLLFPQKALDESRSPRAPQYPDSMFLIPTSPYSCPVCQQPVTLVSPSWLRVVRDYKRHTASVVVDPHLPDPCPSCQPEPVNMGQYVHRRALLDSGDDQLVYACKGTLPPKKVSRNREVAFTEYFVVSPSPIPPDWAYPHEVVNFPGGTAFHRLWLAITFAYADAQAKAVSMVWRGGRDDARKATPVVELDGTLSLSRNRDLLALTIRQDEVPAITVHTLDTARTQVRGYVASLESGARPTLAGFLESGLTPRVDLRTWRRYTRTWGLTWADLLAEVRR